MRDCGRANQKRVNNWTAKKIKVILKKKIKYKLKKKKKKRGFFIRFKRDTRSCFFIPS